MSSKKHIDILVIGSGPGGYAAAFRAADLGREVIIAYSDSLKDVEEAKARAIEVAGSIKVKI